MVTEKEVADFLRKEYDDEFLFVAPEDCMTQGFLIHLTKFINERTPARPAPAGQEKEEAR